MNNAVGSDVAAAAVDRRSMDGRLGHSPARRAGGRQATSAQNGSLQGRRHGGGERPMQHIPDAYLWCTPLPVPPDRSADLALRPAISPRPNIAEDAPPASCQPIGAKRTQFASRIRRFHALRPNPPTSCQTIGAKRTQLSPLLAQKTRFTPRTNPMPRPPGPGLPAEAGEAKAREVSRGPPPAGKHAKQSQFIA